MTLRLDEDILRYATLVDTPGLRDPDPKRRRVALDAITAMDGWIYLMAAGKAETGVISDLHEIREEGHNLHGVVCISKVNTINEYRMKLPEEVTMRVAKNTLVRRATEDFRKECIQR